MAIAFLFYWSGCRRGEARIKTFNLINKSFEIFLVAIVALQAVLLMGGFVLRYLFSSPIVWGDEIVRYSLIWMTFVGAAMATKENQLEKLSAARENVLNLTV